MEKTIKIYNVTGAIQSEVNTTSQSYILKKGDFNPGIYLLNVEFENEDVQSIKIVFE